MDPDCKAAEGIPTPQTPGNDHSLRHAKKAKARRTYFRKVDVLGRVTLPSRIRKALDIHPEDELRFYTTDHDEIVLTKNGPTCIFCGSPYQIVEVRNVCMCIDCFKAFRHFAEMQPEPDDE